MSLMKLAVIAVFVTITFAACQSTSTNGTNSGGNASSGSQTPKPVATPDVIAQAKDVYATNCMICHKENATGGPVTIEGKKLKPDNLTSDKMKATSDEKLIGYVANGMPEDGMPAFKDKLSPEEIKLAVAHLRRLQGP
jgi:mono/diheme cytochrome c family protein